MANASLVEVDTSIFRKAFAAYDYLTGRRACSAQAVNHTNLSPSDLVREPYFGRAAASSEGQNLAQELTWMPLPDKPSVAVLPFENLSIDPKQEALG
jgi:hypothetical protein